MVGATLAVRGDFVHMRSFGILALAVLMVSPLVLAQPVQTYYWMPGQGEPDPEMGPDVPTTPLPIATIVVFENEVWAWTAGERTHTISVPTGWNRVVMEYNQRPEGDPWDRLFVVMMESVASADASSPALASSGRVEVLRGTTPRSNMTITKDMTRYGALLPQGGVANVTVDTSSWEIGPQVVTLTLRFYNDPTSMLVEPQWDHAVSGYANRGLCKNSVIDVPVTFPANTPAKGTFEFFATGHGSEEEQFSSRHFDVLVDGQPLTSVYIFPYTYAIQGFYDPYPNPYIELNNDVIHPAQWWTAQRALDVAGIHTGPGEIPPYRLQLNADQLSLLSGAHTVEVRAGGVYNCLWITSVSFLLDEA